MSNQSMSTFWGESVSIPAGEYTSGWELYSKASSKREDMHDILFLDLLKQTVKPFHHGLKVLVTKGMIKIL